jgi:transposase-like protein
MATDDRAPKTLQTAILHYADLDVCQAELVAARWPDGVTCPQCGSKDVTYLSTQRRWQCRTKHSLRQFSVKVGTIFEDSPISLSKWFVAIWLISAAKNGISSYELHRAIGVTQKTAWFMLHRIRLAMQTKTFTKLGGEVEADETYIGGKSRFMHQSKRERLGMKNGRSGIGKVAVMGLLERHGPDKHSTVRTTIISGTKKRELQATIRAHVEPGASVYTDALKSYTGLDSDYVHQVIDHAEAYVDGQVHTNGCENFWSLLKRAIKGTYVSVEPFHLFRYLDEQSFRFNTRTAKDGERFAEMTTRVAGRRLTYKALTGKEALPA